MADTNSPQYLIIFRACDVVYSVNKAPRPFGLDKRTLIKVCFLSLWESLQRIPRERWQILLLGDKLSDELQAFFQTFEITIINGNWGNDESIRQSLGLALQRPDEEWIYFCEDDYLHQPETFERIDECIQNRQQIFTTKPRPFYMALLYNRVAQRPLVIHPPDYPDRYLPKYRRFSMLFLAPSCHWRQITSTTFTFLARTSTVRRFRRVLQKSSNGANDGYLSRKMFARLFWGRKTLCISPMPGLSTHLHDGVMTPLVDWDKLLQNITHRYPEYFCDTITPK